MLGVEDYGSDAESGDETSLTTSKTTSTSKPLTGPTSTLASKLPPPASKSKSTFALPPPKSSSSSLTLPPPSSTDATNSAPPKQKRIKKIAINLPDLPPPEEEEDERPPAKKPRIASTTSSTGAGKSTLLNMLPAPKRAVPVIEKKEGERVLGGGGGPGLVFRSSRSESRSEVVTDSIGGHGRDVDAEAEAEPALNASGPSTSFFPPSLKKGRANISLDDEGPSRPPKQPHKSAAPAVDFFSLGSNTTSTRFAPVPAPVPSTSTTTTTTVTSAPSTSSAPTISSAPNVPNFRPPSPTLDDPYPGYYQLPSGAYAPYDAGYYASYARKWKSEYDKHIRALEKSQYTPETENVDMAAEMEKARREVKEREDRKALTAGNLGTNQDGEPEMPRMNVKGAKLGSVAKSRHQLTTLLTEAYLNREVLEDKIAQARRNRKEAGNKYGF